MAMKEKIDLDLLEKECISGKLPVSGDFKFRNKSLFFLGTYHVHEALDSNHEIFNLIEKSILENKPTAILIEGEYFCPSLKGSSISTYINSLKGRGLKDKVGEPYYTAYLAEEYNIPFFGAELDPIEIVNIFKESEFNYIDYIFYTYLVTLTGRKDLGELEAIELARNHFLSDHEIVFDESNDFNSFIKWYELNQSKKFVRSSLDISDITPLYDKSELFTQKLNSILNYNRNKKIISVIAELLEKYDSLLVVYGGGHYYQMQRVLNKMFS